MEFFFNKGHTLNFIVSKKAQFTRTRQTAQQQWRLFLSLLSYITFPRVAAFPDATTY
jgi:hypothetical protein